MTSEVGFHQFGLGPSLQSKAIDLDSNMEAKRKKKMKVADDKCLLVSDFDV